ncbi:hypothetical protein PENNAL_c0050G08220 [Penicillium nalgiovense]|uniref:TeaA receptor TeaR n=1 Tax=Penicillium nalgiovense TaxID=60175 RepID=A0A1V6XX78_PENNA|nr:hypothetical protein PENNAL_c0050G08220 [Penicillium nalgiovense]CAG7976437.1 unnamed protein product [Penicillium nalgiovense]
MAGVATAAYSADALASPVDGSQWDFAVPLANEENHPSKQRNSHDSNSVCPKFSRQRTSNGSRSSSVSRTARTHESPYLASNRGRREPSLNRHGSEAGSMRDAFGHEAAGRKESEEANDGETHLVGKTNQEKWIHRDKLAKIESEELHQAAILFQRRMRGESKSSAGRGRSHDAHHANGTGTATSPATEYSEPWPKVREESGKQNVNDNVEDHEREHWDLRRPEEIAADDAAASIYSHPSLGKSASRIPVSTASPVPISAALGRDSRSSRSRAATDEEDRSSRSRRASEPINVEQDGSTPSPESRPGSRGFSSTPNTLGKKTVKTTGSTNRKTSAPPTNRKASTPRSRAVSGNNTQRPTTRGGDRPPTAANRPEGDPPWLATMYKPDPRLPPDQQMIPTVAKRIMQEQWEKEGRTPNTYDRNFEPLAVHPPDAPPAATKVEPEQQPVESLQLEELPPQPPKSPEPPRPNTSTGYSTMPKVQDTPPMGLTPNPNPNWSPPVVTAQQPPKKEKSCGCCIVM